LIVSVSFPDSTLPKLGVHFDLFRVRPIFSPLYEIVSFWAACFLIFFPDLVKGFPLPNNKLFNIFYILGSGQTPF